MKPDIDLPADPMIRLALLSAWTKREWKLVVGAVILVFVTVVAVSTFADQRESVWTSQELTHLSRLPVVPDGVRPAEPLREPTADELEQLERMRARLQELEGLGGPGDPASPAPKAGP